MENGGERRKRKRHSSHPQADRFTGVKGKRRRGREILRAENARRGSGLHYVQNDGRGGGKRSANLPIGESDGEAKSGSLGCARDDIGQEEEGRPEGRRYGGQGNGKERGRNQLRVYKAKGEEGPG